MVKLAVDHNMMWFCRPWTLVLADESGYTAGDPDERPGADPVPIDAGKETQLDVFE